MEGERGQGGCEGEEGGSKEPDCRSTAGSSGQDSHTEVASGEVEPGKDTPGRPREEEEEGGWREMGGHMVAMARQTEPSLQLWYGHSADSWAVETRNHPIPAATAGNLLASCSHLPPPPPACLHQWSLLLSRSLPLLVAAYRQRHTWISCHAYFSGSMPLWSRPLDSHAPQHPPLGCLHPGDVAPLCRVERSPPAADVERLQQGHCADQW